MDRSRNLILKLGIAWLFSNSGLFAQTPVVTEKAPVKSPATPDTEKIEVQILNSARVYYPGTFATGEKCSCSKVGVVRSRAIFNTIPEFKEIARRGLDPDSAEYLLFMKQASDKFKDAVSRTVRRGGFDVIGESGSISVKNAKVVDVTDLVLRNL